MSFSSLTQTELKYASMWDLILLWVISIISPILMLRKLLSKMIVPWTTITVNLPSYKTMKSEAKVKGILVELSLCNILFEQMVVSYCSRPNINPRIV